MLRNFKFLKPLALTMGVFDRDAFFRLLPTHLSEQILEAYRALIELVDSMLHDVRPEPREHAARAVVVGARARLYL